MLLVLCDTYSFFFQPHHFDDKAKKKVGEQYSLLVIVNTIHYKLNKK
jgi:hypothetical protein